MSRRQLVLLASLLIALAVVQFLNLLLVESDPIRVFNSNLFQAVSALIAAGLLTVLVVRLRRQDDPRAAGWRWFAAGAWCWALGMLSFMYVEVVQGRQAYPGFPDLFFLAFYPLAIWGLLRLPRPTLSPQARLENSLDIAALTVLSAMVIWAFNIHNLLRSLFANPDLASDVSMAYALLDMLFLWVLFAVLVRQLIHSSRFPSILMLLAGCLCLVIANLMQGYIILTQPFVSGGMVDLGWVLFSVLIGLAAAHRVALPDTLPPDVPLWHLSFVGRTIFVVIVTYLWLGLMLFLLVWHEFLQPGADPYLLPFAVVTVFGIAIYRQVRSIKKNARLYDLLEQAHAELELKVQERTEELQTQTERLCESEARSRAIFETSPMGIAIVDVATLRFVEVNAGFLDILGYDQDELFTRTVADVTHPDDWDDERKSMQKQIDDRSESFSLDKRYVRKDGSIRWARVTGSLHNLEPGRMFAIANVMDITERKRAEDSLRESEQRLYAVLDDIRKVAVQGYKPDGTITFWNKASEEFYGFTASEIIGKDIVEVLHNPETRDEERRMMAEAARPDALLPSGELQVKRKDGSTFWVYANRVLISRPGKEAEFFCFDIDITERKQVELALRQSEEKYRDVVETTGTGYHTLDLQGRVIDANAEYLRLTGRKDLNEIVGHSVLEWTAPYDLERNDHAIRECIDTCSVRNLIIDYVSPDGRATPIEINATLVDTADGLIILALCRDITERRETEQALRLTQFSVEHASDAAYWMDSEARFVYVNEAACQSLGYSREELLGMTVFDIDPAFTREQWAETWREMERQGSVRLETVHRTKQGEVFPVEISANFLDFGGKQYDFAFARDISERKRAEEALRDSEWRLERSQEIAHVGSWDLDLSTNRLIWSDEAYRIFGLRPREFGATYEAFLEAVHPDDRAGVDEAYFDSVREGRDAYEIEHRVVRKHTNEVRYVHEKCTHIKDACSRIIRSVGMVQDITAAKQAEQRERESETHKLEFYRRTILAATGGKLRICEPDEIENMTGPTLGSWEINVAEDIGEIRHAVADLAESAGMEQRKVEDSVVAVGEATTNALKHAGRGACSIHSAPDALVFVVSDQGSGIEALALPEVALKAGYTTAASLGMGYKAMIGLSDRVYLATAPGGTTVAIEMKLQADDQDLVNWPETW